MEYKFGKNVFLKRVIALVIDLCCVLAVFFAMNAIFENTVLKNEEYTTAIKNANQLCVDSHLFVYKDDSQKAITPVSGDARDQALKDFYLLYEGNLDTYNNAKKEKGDLFVKDSNGEYVLALDKNGNYDTVQYNSFLNDEMDKAYYNVLTKTDKYMEYQEISEKYTYPIVISSFAVPLILFFYVLPIIFKNGQTLGKKLMKIYVVSTNDLTISEGMYTIRFLIFIIEIISSIFLFGIPIFIDAVTVLVSKKGQALHDFVVSSYVVDLNGNKLYHNIEEKNKDIEKSQENGK